MAVNLRDEKGSDLWMIDVERGVASRLTAMADREADPVWSPDGRLLAFCVWPAGSNERGELRAKAVRVGDPDVVMLDSGARACPESWSSDGRTLFVHRRQEAGGRVTGWALLTDGTKRLDPILGGAEVDEPQISPDGRWMAYTSPPSGAWEVYVEPYGRPGERVRISAKGGGQVKWRGDGRELFYGTPAGELMAVDVTTQGDRLEVGVARRLFGLRTAYHYGLDEFAPARDGQRFLVKLPVDEKPRRLHIVTNWPALLEGGIEE